MGVFDFIRNIGKSIMPGNEGPEIQQNITSLLGGQVQNLKVEYDDGLVRLSGLVDSVAAKQKAVLLAGNVKGVEKVNDDGLQVKPQAVGPKPEPEYSFYTIVKGDSLSKIAKKYYGNANEWT
jgi:nucleoid-associated protein YgaU